MDIIETIRIIRKETGCDLKAAKRAALRLNGTDPDTYLDDVLDVLEEELKSMADLKE